LESGIVEGRFAEALNGIDEQLTAVAVFQVEVG
jgi:hypothetical protein